MSHEGGNGNGHARDDSERETQPKNMHAIEQMRGRVLFLERAHEESERDAEQQRVDHAHDMGRIDGKQDAVLRALTFGLGRLEEATRSDTAEAKRQHDERTAEAKRQSEAVAKRESARDARLQLRDLQQDKDARVLLRLLCVIAVCIVASVVGAHLRWY